MIFRKKYLTEERILVLILIVYAHKSLENEVNDPHQVRKINIPTTWEISGNYRVSHLLGIGLEFTEISLSSLLSLR